jgi:aminoglycoside 6'-N-acetyltransferase I
VEGTSSSPVGYLEAIYVKPEFRNQGIAKKLVDFAKNWSIERGCSELASDCELDNEISRKFHNKIGFEEANTIVCFTMDLKL